MVETKLDPTDPAESSDITSSNQDTLEPPVIKDSLKDSSIDTSNDHAKDPLKVSTLGGITDKPTKDENEEEGETIKGKYWESKSRFAYFLMIFFVILDLADDFSFDWAFWFIVPWFIYAYIVPWFDDEE